MIEYRCDGEWVIAAWQGYEARALLDWPEFPEFMSQNAKQEMIETACDEAADELRWQINSAGRDFDGKGERK